MSYFREDYKLFLVISDVSVIQNIQKMVVLAIVITIS